MSSKQRVLFVTVGTTALSAKNLGCLGSNAKALQDCCAEFLKGESNAAHPPNLLTKVLKAHEELWNDPDLGIHKHADYTSAEMASSFFALKVDASVKLFDPSKDQIVLLASATNQGKFCATVNSNLARKYLFSKHAVETDAVVVAEIEHLDVKVGGFKYEIADNLKAIWDAHPATEEVLVNITGGFKGTIPFLTWRCYENWAQRKKCRMFYAHERMDRVEVISFTDSGLAQTQLIIT